MCTSLTRTLYRECLRTAKQVERLTREHSAPRVAKTLQAIELRESDHISLLMKTFTCHHVKSINLGKKR